MLLPLFIEQCFTTLDVGCWSHIIRRFTGMHKYQQHHKHTERAERWNTLWSCFGHNSWLPLSFPPVRYIDFHLTPFKANPCHFTQPQMLMSSSMHAGINLGQDPIIFLVPWSVWKWWGGDICKSLMPRLLICHCVFLMIYYSVIWPRTDFSTY